MQYIKPLPKLVSVELLIHLKLFNSNERKFNLVGFCSGYGVESV